MLFTYKHTYLYIWKVVLLLWGQCLQVQATCTDMVGKLVSKVFQYQPIIVITYIVSDLRHLKHEVQNNMVWYWWYFRITSRDTTDSADFDTINDLSKPMITDILNLNCEALGSWPIKNRTIGNNRKCTHLIRCSVFLVIKVSVVSFVFL